MSREHESPAKTFHTRMACLKITKNLSINRPQRHLMNLPGGPAISPRKSVKQSFTNSSLIEHCAISSELKKQNK